MTSWHSYPPIFNLGHRAVRDLLQGPVLVEEKIDGSQFSFGLFEATEYDAGSKMGEDSPTFSLRIRSKGAEMHLDAPEKMFLKAVETVKGLQERLRPGWTYRAEYLAKPKHGTLSYDRVPQGYLILFDINPSEEEYLDYDAKQAEAERLGLEVVPRLFQGILSSAEAVRVHLEKVSVLGGSKNEGVVIKPLGYNVFGPNKKVLMGKFVSEAFKEVHQGEWRKENPSGGDIIQRLIGELRTPARWAKAVQHLREAGSIEDSPRDIGAIIKEAQKDVLKEESERMMQVLFTWAKGHVLRGSVAGLAEWYKEQLLKKQFEGGADAGQETQAVGSTSQAGESGGTA